MATIKGQGNFINGSFIDEGNITLTSKNPSCNFAPIFTVNTDEAQVSLAVDAAKKAYNLWTYKSLDERIHAILSLKHSFIQNEEAIAHAISLEMGKIKSEALIEAKGLSARIDLIIDHGLKRVANESLYHLRAQTRYHNQGVLAVIGPFNFPAHLVNSHVIPSILLGNTVIIKPSEVCPMVAEIYAKCVKESLIPPGVINTIHGDGRIGQLLCQAKDADGILFTGSYKTGRALKEALLDDPNKILALELGGKNFAVVMDDADLKQALSEIVLGGFLTTGQRCTATSRVLVHKNVFERFKEMLIKVVRELRPQINGNAGLFGPLATKESKEIFLQRLEQAKDEGAIPLVDSVDLPGGGFVTPSLFQVSPEHQINSYLGEELFGPNLCLEEFSSLDQAIMRINQSPYGLSNSIFTIDPINQEKMFYETKSGVLNFNRSTNNAFGQMPFGGVKKSGNQRPAGIDAVRNATFPTAVTSQPYGHFSFPSNFNKLIDEFLDLTSDINLLALRHEVEAVFETFGIHCDFSAKDRICFHKKSFDNLGSCHKDFFLDLELALKPAAIISHDHLTIDLAASKRDQDFLFNLNRVLKKYVNKLGLSLKKPIPLEINVPPEVAIPRSRALLDRLYHKNFVPREKKSLVADLKRSRGSFLASVDDDPLVLLDAASQIASIGAGFKADVFLNAYDCNELDLALLKNFNLALDNNDEGSDLYRDALKAKKDLEIFLHDRSNHKFNSVAYAAGGSEANEIAFDQARLNGPGGTRILAFDGSFHGRTIMALQATHNPQKREPFAFKGFEATFLPFPALRDPCHQPKMPPDFLERLSIGEIPSLSIGDQLLGQELQSLGQLKEEASKGNICCVIIEPMQCEGGDRYASDRFFCGLRALTRALNIPLIFDEVQTGFNLGREFFWYQQLQLVDKNNNPEHPDIVTLAKKAQLGVCLSVWPNLRHYAPHVIQLKRSLLHAKALDKDMALEIEQRALKELGRLRDYFPNLVHYPRACGFAFAFDVPTKEIAMKLLEDRFNWGFMAYIAGEKTLRFRLNATMSQRLINRLFERLFMALWDIREKSSSIVIKRDNKLLAKTSLQISNIRFEQLCQKTFAKYKTLIEEIEQTTYEQGRQDTMDDLCAWLSVKDGFGIVMKCTKDGEDIFAGYVFGGPLEKATSEGPLGDKNRLHENTFYIANLTLNQKVRGFGIGEDLKKHVIKILSSFTNHDGSLRYHFMTGRNRVGKAKAIGKINEKLGAYLVAIHNNQYNEKGAQALYYRIHLAKGDHRPNLPKKEKFLDCRNDLENHFHHIPNSYLTAVKNDRLRDVVGSKITLSNWATPNTVRYCELLQSVIPKHLHHCYLTSGRDEMLDKALRSLRFHRKNADLAIGFSHQWFGNITAASRSLSHSVDEKKPFDFFNWPKIDHPMVVGIDESLKQVRDIINTIDPNRVLGIVMELVGERSALHFENGFLSKLEEIRKGTGIPLVFVENTTSLGRMGTSLFFSDALPTKANMVLWHAGGQLGHVFVDDEYFVDKPLTLISTWDGDEISIMRSYHAILNSFSKEHQTNIKMFEDMMSSLKPKANIKGLGTWHALCFNDIKDADHALLSARNKGVLLGRGFGASVMICPKPDFSKDQFEHVFETVKSLALNSSEQRIS